MKILLINPVIRASDYPPTRFPLGLAYIARVLLDNSHNIKVLDLNANRFKKDKIIEIIKKADAGVFCLTGLITEYQQVKWLSLLIRKYHKNKKIILGGALGTSVPELILRKTEVDVIINSEGERTAVELMDCLDKNKDVGKIKGIYFKKNNKLKFTGSRELIKNLDKIPFPARDLFPFEKYISSSHLKLFDPKIRSTQIITSRGCPYRCTYCFKSMWGQKFRQRTVENVIEEIKMLHDKYNINGIFFNDDEFVLNRKWVSDFCNALKKENLDISWVANGRVNLMTKDLLKKMRSAGCRVICYGIESGSQEILNEMKKDVTVKQAKQAIKNTWNAGILPHGYLMIGMFSETKQTIEETIKLCNETALIGQFAFVTPFPETEIYYKAKQLGKIKHSDEWLLEHWGEFNEKLLVNLTSMSDEELKSLKRYAEKKILFGNLLINIWRHYKLIKLKNIIREGIFMVKRWYSRKY